MLAQIVEDCNINLNESASVYIGRDTRYNSVLQSYYF